MNKIFKIINTNSIVFKIIFTLILLFGLFSFYFYNENKKISIQSFNEIQQSKIFEITTIIEPLVSLNLSFGSEKNAKKILNNIMIKNNSIVFIKISYNEKEFVLKNDDFFSKKNNSLENIDKYNKKLIDPSFKKNIGEMEIWFYDKNYINKIKQYNDFLLNSIIIIFIILIIFIFYFISFLNPLKYLSIRIKNYEVDKNELINIDFKYNKKDEVGIIIDNFMDLNKNLIQHSTLLKEMNQNLDLKVQEKTKELNKILKDLDEKVKIETKKNIENQKLLIQQSKLASMGEMIGNIAHQWRQPLNALNILLFNIKNYYRKDKLNDEILNKFILEGDVYIKKMSNTIDDFKNFFKPDNKKELFSINEVIKESLNLLSGSMKNNNITIKNKIKIDEKVEGFKNQFSQVIINILNNSKDAIMEKKIQKGTIEIYINKINDKNQIIIEDNAGGIPEKIIDRIFEPYFTTKHQSHGTGIGLYMSKTIIEKNFYGKMKVENTKNGAKFTIIL